MKRLTAGLMVTILATGLVAGCAKQAEPTKPKDAVKVEAKDNSLELIKSAKKLRIGSNAAVEPAEFVNKDGKVDGFFPDVAKEVAKRIGVEPEFVINDWDTIFKNMDAGKYDVIVSGANVTPERQKVMNMIPYVEFSMNYVTRAGEATVKAEKDLAGKKVTAQDNSFQMGLLKKVKDEKGINFDLIPHAVTDAGAQMLLDKKADVWVMDEPIAIWYSNKTDGKIVLSGEFLPKAPMGIAVRKNDEALTKAVEKAMTDMKADGSYQNIYDKWFKKK